MLLVRLQVQILLLALLAGCSSIGMPPVRERPSRDALQDAADAYLGEKLGGSVAQKQTVFQETKLHAETEFLFRYCFVDEFDSNIRVPLYVYVTLDANVRSYQNLPPCAEDPELCRDFLQWHEAWKLAPNRRYPLRSSADFAFKLHESGRFVWEFKPRSFVNPQRLQLLTIDAKTGEFVGNPSDRIEICCSAAIGCSVRRGIPVALDGGLQGTLYRNIYSTVLVHE